MINKHLYIYVDKKCGRLVRRKPYISVLCWYNHPRQSVTDAKVGSAAAIWTVMH